MAVNIVRIHTITYIYSIYKMELHTFEVMSRLCSTHACSQHTVRTAMTSACTHIYHHNSECVCVWAMNTKEFVRCIQFGAAMKRSHRNRRETKLKCAQLSRDSIYSAFLCKFCCIYFQLPPSRLCAHTYSHSAHTHIQPQTVLERTELNLLRAMPVLYSCISCMVDRKTRIVHVIIIIIIELVSHKHPSVFRKFTFSLCECVCVHMHIANVQSLGP